MADNPFRGQGYDLPPEFLAALDGLYNQTPGTVTYGNSPELALPVDPTTGGVSAMEGGLMSNAQVAQQHPEWFAGGWGGNPGNTGAYDFGFGDQNNFWGGGGGFGNSFLPAIFQGNQQGAFGGMDPSFWSSYQQPQTYQGALGGFQFRRGGRVR